MSTMTERVLVINPCTVNVYGPADGAEVFIKIHLDAEGELHLTGVEGPKRNGDAWGSCGQIDMHEWEVVTYHRGWDADRVAELRAIWKRWHLNHMVAGSPAQMAHLRSFEGEPWREDKQFSPRGYPDHFMWAKHVLAKAGLQPDPAMDPPYSYGSAWLREDVPQDVLDWLFALPETTKEPAWV